MMMAVKNMKNSSCQDIYSTSPTMEKYEYGVIQEALCFMQLIIVSYKKFSQLNLNSPRWLSIKKKWIF